MIKVATSEKVLPLFEYAKKFEDFDTYEDFDSYFIQCIHTCGIKKSDIAKAMNLSESGLSLRMNMVGLEGPRFNTNHIQAYIDFTGDSRPWQYLKWRQERTVISREVTVRQMIGHLTSEIKRLSSLLEEK
jgi:hypothetical protein